MTYDKDKCVCGHSRAMHGRSKCAECPRRCRVFLPAKQNAASIRKFVRGFVKAQSQGQSK